MATLGLYVLDKVTIAVHVLDSQSWVKSTLKKK